MKDPRKKFRDAIFEVVENQLREGTPPETRQTFERLVLQGHSEEEARRLIGAVVSMELYELMKHGTPFDLERFVARLESLPDMPQDKQPGG